MIKEEKDKKIEELNRNYRTILSYGKDVIIPVGEFIVEDIIVNEIPEEYADNILKEDVTTIVLKNIEDDRYKITLPANVFFNVYHEKARKNAELLKIGNDINYNIEDLQDKWLNQAFTDKMLDRWEEANLLTLDECDADYMLKNQIMSKNYSICPIDLGKYRERVMSHYDYALALNLIRNGNGNVDDIYKKREDDDMIK